MGGGLVYIVMATEGEYSDRREWPVVGYGSEAAARAEVERLDALARHWAQKFEELDQDCADDDWWDRRERLAARAAKALGDGDFRFSGGGRSHFLYTVAIRRP